MNHSTRESWLEAATKALAPRFKPFGPLPKKLHVLSSFPYKSKTAVGMQFSQTWTKDASTYIAISPVLGNEVCLGPRPYREDEGHHQWS